LTIVMGVRRRFILWDVDGTLVSAGPAARDAFDLAVAATVGRSPHGHGVEMSGKTDPQIAMEILAALELSEGEARGHLPVVLRSLEEELQTAADLVREHGRVMPGIGTLLPELHAAAGVVQSVLTGNLEANARLKVGTFGLHRWLDLDVGAYGSDDQDRSRLVPVALAKVRDRRGIRFEPGDVWVVGDTPLDLVSATEVSCNIYYALTGLQTGGAALVDYAKRMGFGAALPFDLPTAVSQVTNGHGKGPGGFKDDVELANAAYGQAEVFVTPLQMALVAATVANNGELMRPQLVTAITGKHSGTRTIGPQSMGRVISPANAQAINAAMVQAIEGPLGRQFTTGAKIPGVLTAGKSGTAELGGTGEPHSWFIGFAPANDPQVVIAVIVEQAGRGGAVAAPIAGNLMARYLAGLK